MFFIQYCYTKVYGMRKKARLHIRKTNIRTGALKLCACAMDGGPQDNTRVRRLEEMASALELLNELASPSVLLACPLVMLNPLIWNLIVRHEYNTRSVSRLCGGPRAGVVLVACIVMVNNSIRTSFFHYIVGKNSKLQFLEDNVGATIAGYVIIGVGVLLVLSSTWRLGFFCTFLGDYFGILLDARVTGFPFNILNHPMFWGSFLIYVGDSVLCASAVAFLSSLFIGLSYVLAAAFEVPFTAKIYAQKETKKI